MREVWENVDKIAVLQRATIQDCIDNFDIKGHSLVLKDGKVAGIWNERTGRFEDGNL